MAEQEALVHSEIQTWDPGNFIQNESELADQYEVHLLNRDPLSSVIPITVLYAVIFLTGIFGNICTCIVIVHKKHMHTSTNCYLFSLAVSDLLLLVIGMPQEIWQLWNRYPYAFGEVFCVLRGLASETSTNVSILTIMCFTMERYFAVSRPLRSQVTSSVSRAVKAIIVLWIVGAACAAPLAFQFGIVKRHYGNLVLEGSDECTLKRRLPHAFELSTLFFFVLPMIAISVLYVLISIKLFRTDNMLVGESSFIMDNGSRRGSPRNSSMNRQSTRSYLGSKGCSSSRTAAVKLLFAVVVAFFICWAPFHTQRLMALYLGPEPTDDEISAYNVLTYVSGVTYFVSATINPIMYSIMSVKFRKAFRETLPSWICFCPTRSPLSGRLTSLYNLRGHYAETCLVA